MTSRAHYRLLMMGMLLVLIALSVMALGLGPSGFLFDLSGGLDSNRHIILHFRGGRIVLAIIAGSSLAASGASLQALFRNTLADPHIFGISGGAALGASVVIAFFAEHAIAPSVGAIVGGLLAFLLLFYYMNHSPSASLGQCLLIGVLINAIAAALITVLKTSLPVNKTQSLLFWLVGHITVVDSSAFWIIIPLWLIGMLGLFAIRGELELLSFGVEEGRLLGVNTDRVIKIAIAANCVLIGNVVAYAGMIGFLGLVVPHFVRLLVGTNQYIVLPLAAIGGAILLVLFDTLSRVSFSALETELPVGAISAIVLSPVFFILLLRDQRNA